MRIIITAGPTREHIDDVRFLSNGSSGRMGFAVADTAQDAGHDVILIAGPTELQPPPVETVRVTSALEMCHAVLCELPGADALVMTAAVCDYRPKERIEGKLKKEGIDVLSLRLVRNPDILAEAGRRKRGQILVGFALESSDLIENAATKLRAKNLDLIVANAPSAMGADRSTVTFLTPNGKADELADASKDRIAKEILRRIERLEGA